MKRALLLLLVVSCRLPPPGTPAGDAIDCGSEAVRRCLPQAVPSVNLCLGTTDIDWTKCLVSLIGPTACSAEAVIACVVRDSGDHARSQVAANGSDVRAARMATRSRDWVSDRGYRFR